PAILAVLVIVFGFFPSILTGTIIDPAVNAISQTTGKPAEFHMFHGFTPAFFSTIVIYVVGILLILTFGYWIRLLHLQPTKL
ncbi:Na+/H+ antiporter subunit A, partial [Staphylococcus aureus]|nr:Na+/H+ antiporter subunit A [Staphylococcus aureus]